VSNRQRSIGPNGRLFISGREVSGRLLDACLVINSAAPHRY
jgi:hypothetical protein